MVRQDFFLINVACSLPAYMGIITPLDVTDLDIPAPVHLPAHSASQESEKKIGDLVFNVIFVSKILH